MPHSKFSIALLIAVSFVIVAQAKEPIRDERTACALLKRHMVKFLTRINALPARCDLTSPGVPADYYVIGLRSGHFRRCSDVCGSSLLGWYAVRKRDGQVHKWNVANMELGPVVRDN